MKKVINTTVFLFCIVDIIYGQLPSDYPFKVILDDSGYVYMTGEENGDIFVSKFNYSGYNIWIKSFLKSGYDKSMDIILSEESFIFLTGYVTNQIDGNYDIIIIKLLNLPTSAQTQWNKSIGNLYFDDQAAGIVVDQNGYPFLTGYEYNKTKGKNIKLIKCNKLNGNILKDTSFNNKVYNGDDVGNDILIDRGYLYILGYT